MEITSGQPNVMVGGGDAFGGNGPFANGPFPPVAIGF